MWKTSIILSYLDVGNIEEENRKMKMVLENMGQLINENIVEEQEGSFLTPSEKMKQDFQITMISSIEGVYT